MSVRISYSLRGRFYFINIQNHGRAYSFQGCLNKFPSRGLISEQVDLEPTEASWQLIWWPRSSVPAAGQKQRCQRRDAAPLLLSERRKEWCMRAVMCLRLSLNLMQHPPKSKNFAVAARTVVSFIGRKRIKYGSPLYIKGTRPLAAARSPLLREKQRRSCYCKDNLRTETELAERK